MTDEPKYQPADFDLFEWSDIEEDFSGGAILLGNGSSLAVDTALGYESLFEIASSTEVANPLTVADIEIFDALETRDFERVLRMLSISRIICRQAGHDEAPLIERYEGIRRALLEAVKSRHPRHGAVPEKRLIAIQETLAQFKEVFTTNYDLIVYWSIVRDPLRRQFRDFFWGMPDLRFHLADASTPPQKTRVYYLHGGFFIYELPSAVTVKARGESGPSGWATYTPLLDVQLDYEGAEFPLFVSEGDAAQKFAAISRSDYLTFAFDRFVEYRGPLVIFGHSLAEQDRHLVDAIKGWVKVAKLLGQTVNIAMSVYTEDREEIIQLKFLTSKKLEGAELKFFNARSFPLA